MRILILGATGMLGHMACRVLGEQHEVWGACRSQYRSDAPLGRFLPQERWISGLDVYKPGSVLRVLRKVRPEAVLNCIGIVKQLDEAKDPLLSIATNSLFPHELNSLCSLVGAKLVHLSTDCVFSGQRGNYSEDDIPDPVDLYGRSKLLGEVADHGALTIRTSIIGRQLSGQTGLVEWILSNKGQTVRGFSRAIYTGLTTQALCRVLDEVLRVHKELSGVWQIASAPITKYDLVCAINERFGLGMRIEKDESFFCDRSLSGERFANHTGIVLPSWEEMLSDLAADRITYDSPRGSSSPAAAGAH